MTPCYPFPDSAVDKIEFVDMSELRPESWLRGMDEEADEKSVATLFKTKKKPVIDILIWVQSFTSYVAVHAQSYPTHLWLTYLATTVQCNHRFEGLRLKAML